ncbi:phospholipase D-like domain-containing protein [Noviluteimonas gilva]|uniref:Cardiolipin synthase B n=1 Tax=Noviluteimonas gilva TaxID=2682097 RepID=A0A7C9HMR8_9GAMM|nr:phospholipase D-like domain-containing protein [Lysobacter gilvus]MUV14476.1 cardiolipin synthase B [Lysobacter gilvus]
MLAVIIVTVLVTFLAVILGLNFVKPEKQIERKVEHRYAAADPQFRREMGVLLGPAIVSHNVIQDLQNGDEIFPAMLQGIRSAKHTISFETYIYWEGEIGREFAAALSERAKAGVAVHVTIDWAGSYNMEDALLDEMKAAGVHVVRYRPLHWYNLSRMNNRTHRKLLIIDGRVAFTGGVGIGDPWRGNAQDADHWRDIHFRVEGPVVAQFQAAFNDNWIKTTGEVLNGPENFPSLESADGMDAHMFISSPSGGSESMHLMYLMAIAAAEHTIDLEAAYFIPDELITNALLAARKRGVQVRVIVPGEKTDSDAARHASRMDWGPMIKAGISISEYQPTMFHNKMLIVDKVMTSVGSTNFDLRSFRLNDEASLNVYDARFADRMTQIFEQDLKQSKGYTYEMWENRPLKEKFIERVILPIRSQL